MKIFQVKHDSDKYCYYKAESKELVTKETKIYPTYPDCKDEINQMTSYQSFKIVEGLIKYFKDDNTRT